MGSTEAHRASGQNPEAPSPHSMKRPREPEPPQRQSHPCEYFFRVCSRLGHLSRRSRDKCLEPKSKGDTKLKLAHPPGLLEAQWLSVDIELKSTSNPWPLQPNPGSAQQPMPGGEGSKGGAAIANKC
eukprot:5483959-Pyramimonas_sp.AAC.1